MTAQLNCPEPRRGLSLAQLSCKQCIMCANSFRAACLVPVDCHDIVAEGAAAAVACRRAIPGRHGAEPVNAWKGGRG